MKTITKQSDLSSASIQRARKQYRAIITMSAIVFSVLFLVIGKHPTNAQQFTGKTQYESLEEILDNIRQTNNTSDDLLLTQRNKFTAGDGALNDTFGYSVSMSEDTVVIGAPGDDVGSNSNQGSAYIFIRNGSSWIQQAKLTASDGATGDQFGYSVAISGNTAIIGAYLDDVGSRVDEGSVYVFARNGTTWTQTQQISPSDGAGDNFGNSLAISENVLVIGALFDDATPNSGQGAVYIFTRSGTMWAQSQKLFASDAASGDHFGLSVALSGNTLVISSPDDDSVGNSAHGSIYIFTSNGVAWTQQAKLTASDLTGGDRFGYSVAISGGTLIAGAWNDAINGNSNQGSAYIFVGSGITWNQQTKLTASNGATNDYFGYAVNITGDTAIVGAFGDDVENKIDQGSAYIFKRYGTSWTQQQQILASDGMADDQFGVSIGISGNKILFGSYADDSTFFNTGSAYIFDNTTTPFDFDGDGKTDVSVFRPSDNNWYIKQSLSGNTINKAFGTSTDKIVPADYDGDGKTDIAIFTPTNGTWSVIYSSTSVLFSLTFGQNGDVPCPGDFDGDGKADFVVLRPSNSTWYYALSANGSGAQQFGQTGDVPVVADYDGDGKADTAIYRPSVGEWWIQRSSNFSVVAAQFGNSADKPVPGDYSGDGRVDTAVFRPSSATWYIQGSTSGYLSLIFGLNDDKPIPSAFVP